MNTKDLIGPLTRKIALQMGDDRHYGRLYRGEASLGFIDPAIRRLYGDRVQALSINHAVTSIAPVLQRLEIAGFRSSAGDVVDQDLTRYFRDLGLAEAAYLAHVEALVTGRCYFLAGEINGQVVVTPESPTQMAVLRDPVTRRIIAALKRYKEVDGTTRAIVMTEETIDTYSTGNGSADLADFTSPAMLTGGDATLVDSQPNLLGTVPVVAVVNQPRLSAPEGRSDLADIESLLVAIAKLGSDLMTASEANAMPHRLVTYSGEMTAEQADSLKERMSRSMSQPAGAHVGVLAGGADIKEMSTASLDNFDRAIRLLVSQIAAIAGLPPYFVSSDVSNPTSADAIRSAESRLTSRVIERQRWFGPAYCEVMRLAVLLRDGRPDPRLADLICLWTNPAPSSIGQQADATVKLASANVLDRRAALESLNLPPLEVERILATPITTA